MSPKSCCKVINNIIIKIIIINQFLQNSKKISPLLYIEIEQVFDHTKSGIFRHNYPEYAKKSAVWGHTSILRSFFCPITTLTR